jgi:hypothetical protein
MEEKKYCPGCEQEKDIEHFSFRYKTRGIRQTWCKSCQAAANKNHYKSNTQMYIDRAKTRNKRVAEENRKKMLIYLSQHPCVDCGNTDIRCLEFDHVRDSKVDDISRMLGVFANWKTIEVEIAKCEVRCANCHRIKTLERADRWRFRATKQS